MQESALSSEFQTASDLSCKYDDPVQALRHDLHDELSIVESLIQENLDSEYVARIAQIGEYIFSAGGKRLRPILTIACACLFGPKGHHHLNFAAAIEFIHTTTLLHDDVVDSSSQRRGRPTANLLWDNKSSILVGDFFFARAFQLMVDTRSLAALGVIAESSVTISEAEVMQLAWQHDITISEDDYFRIINGKTACLFAAAAQVGALIAGASESESQAAFRFGRALGISFQIRDDVLDFDGCKLSLGKDLGDDFRDRKMTLPMIRAMQAASTEEQDFWKRTIAEGQQHEGDFEYVRFLLKSRGHLEQVQEEAVAWSEKAKSELENLPPHPLRDRLEWLADFSAIRQN